MNLYSLWNQPTEKDVSAEIISYADSNHYLLNFVSNSTRQPELVKGKHDKPLVFNSVDEAKQWLKKRGFTRAYLRMDTAYEEMMGEKAPSAKITIPLLH